MTTTIPMHRDQLLTTAAAVLLSHAIAAIHRGDEALTIFDITLPTRYQLSHVGPGTRHVSPFAAWDELHHRGLIEGTHASWAPTSAAKEVADQ